MSTTLNPKVLQEEKGELASVIRQMAETINGESRDFTPEERERWEQVNSDYNSVEARLVVSRRVDAIEKEDDEKPRGRMAGREDIDPTYDEEEDRPRGARRPVRRGMAPTFEQRDLAVEGYMRGQFDLEVEPYHVRAMAACGMKPNAKVLRIPLLTTRQLHNFKHQSRAAGMSTAAVYGAEYIPEGFVSAVEAAMLATSPLRQIARVLRTATGNDLPWPTANDTGISGRLLAEETAVTETPITTAATTFLAYKYTSDMVLVSPELLQDEGVGLVSLIGTLLGERIGRILNLHFTTGTGTAQPRGVVVAAQANNATNADSSLTIGANDLIDLVHTVDPAYRGGNTRWMVHDNVIGHIRKLTVTDQGFIWQPSLIAGDPDRLLGFPLHFNQDMASGVAPFVAGDESVLFGDFDKYVIREVAGMRFRRLTERYADTDQEGFISFVRADADTIDNTTPFGVLTIIA